MTIYQLYYHGKTHPKLYVVYDEALRDAKKASAEFPETPVLIDRLEYVASFENGKQIFNTEKEGKKHV